MVLMMRIYTTKEMNFHPFEEATIKGTLLYMSPEQASGKTNLINKQSDIHCMGATLYHILRGIPPFYGCKDDIFLLKQSSDPESVRHPRPGVLENLPLPDELVVICERAMQRNQLITTMISLN